MIEDSAMKVLVTGGAGFIGSAVCRRLISETPHVVVNVDKLSYAASVESIAAVAENPRYSFHEADICDGMEMRRILRGTRPDAIINLAAETNVDRSISAPDIFIETNIVGTATLLQAAHVYLTQEAPQKAGVFRFLHVSTDEVFGSLDDDELPFDETSVYDPSSPYSASKAASDHLVRAWGRTYGLSVLLSNLSNSYGPFQYPDKLIPRMITYAIDGMPLPVYGTGENRRDWLHVEDGARALEAVLINGAPGQRYLIGGRTERRNIDVVKALCGILDRLRPRPNGARHADLVRYITDRPGHDFRYAMDTSRMTAELGWAPARHFEAGLEETVRWYLHNEWWWRPLRDRLRDEQSQFVRRMPI